MAKIVGIDFGAQMSGNTVIAHIIDEKIEFNQVAKKQNTDSWLKITIKEIKPETVYMDAPLSLPKAYYGQGNNFHYRLADIETRAMSPMFLGGLTARAMSLKNQFEGIHFFEVYPAYFQSKIVQSNHYKKDMDKFLSDLQKKIPLPLADTPDNWHQIDALIALISGLRHQKNEHLSIGETKEGIIII